MVNIKGDLAMSGMQAPEEQQKNTTVKVTI
jgi:hypothetical protein